MREPKFASVFVELILLHEVLISLKNTKQMKILENQI